MTRDGRVEGSGPDASISVSAKFDQKSGTVSGQINQAEKK
jgi:hypothetical protein